VVAAPPSPAGIGRCKSCAFVETGTPAICFGCFRKTIPQLEAPKCKLCDHPVPGRGSACINPVCGWSDLPFDWNLALAKRTDLLRNIIASYKFHDFKGWAEILARVLVGALDENEENFHFDLIVASPTYVAANEEGVRKWDHTRLVLEHANELAEGRWPFDLETPAAIVKTQKTTPLSSITARSDDGRTIWRQRYDIARTELRAALQVPDPQRTRGKDILVYDDVFTDGLTLYEVARGLMYEGRAKTVCGITLARQIYRAR
jgi:predicted amidophosphoribosyltransferase